MRFFFFFLQERIFYGLLLLPLRSIVKIPLTSTAASLALFFIVMNIQLRSEFAIAIPSGFIFVPTVRCTWYFHSC